MKRRKKESPENKKGLPPRTGLAGAPLGIEISPDIRSGYRFIFSLNRYPLHSEMNFKTNGLDLSFFGFSLFSFSVFRSFLRFYSPVIFIRSLPAGFPFLLSRHSFGCRFVRFVHSIRLPVASFSVLF